LIQNENGPEKGINMTQNLFILESRLKYALEYTKSISQAARYLHVSRKTVYKYMELYNIDYSLYSNKAGIGIPKTKIAYKYKLSEILTGKHNGVKFNKQKLLTRLVKNIIFEEKCDMCGFNERRLIDERCPLMIDNINEDLTDWREENLRFLCYNCYFLNVGNMNGKKINAFHDPVTGDIIEELTE